MYAEIVAGDVSVRTVPRHVPEMIRIALYTLNSMGDDMPPQYPDDERDDDGDCWPDNGPTLGFETFADWGRDGDTGALLGDMHRTDCTFRNTNTMMAREVGYLVGRILLLAARGMAIIVSPSRSIL